MVAIIYPEMNVLEGGLQKGSLSLICFLISSIVKALLLFTCQYSSISFFVSSLILLFKLLFCCLVSESFIRAFFDCSTTLYTLSIPILSLFDICFGLSLSTKYNSRSLDSTADFLSFTMLLLEIGICSTSISSFISSSLSLCLSSSPSKIELSSLYPTKPILISYSFGKGFASRGCSFQN